MKCRYCNAENPKQALKCNNCGNILDEETKPNGDMETVVLDASTLINIDPLSFSPGENFGDRYQIIEEIGQGGMGRVFKAKDMELNTVVALKMIKPQLSSDPSIVNRFKRELLLAREIIHEHVIRIHDLGEIKGIKYISMNYIQGNTIKEILQTTGKFTLEKSIDIIKQVCNALQAAHNKGIIHRDLKPQNIIIDKTGKAYVLDFGIAHSQNLDGEISEEGVIMGTPDYMAPEQIKGNKTTAATDIYSLGIILYEMLTGQLPFAAKNQKELLYKNLNELPTSPSEINPLIPVKLESIILKCMEKNERDRYQAISEILVDIELDKTVEIPPIKKLSINEKKTQRSFFKTLIWVISPFFVIYGLVSILSLVMDSIYHVKIEKLQVEYDTHYKNYFPIKKNWLPNQWEIKQCNSWEKYQELFSVTKKKDQFITSKDSNDNNLLKITYHDHLQLKKMLMQQKTGIKPIELSDALKCTELDPRTKENKKLDIGIILHHLDFKILEARLHFLERNYKQGLTILYHWMIFSLDLFTASRDYNIQNTALICYSKICIEMLPLFLSYEFNDNTLPPYKIECLSLFGNYKVGVLPNIYESPNQETRTPPPIVRAIEQFIKLSITKFEPRTLFYKEYLNLINYYPNIQADMGMDETKYQLYEKFRFWEHWFSINRYFYKKGIGFYQGLLKEYIYIKDMGGKTHFSNDYYREKKPNRKIITANIPLAMFRINKARTLGRLVLIVLYLNQYGKNSSEFLDLKGSENFIDDMRGNKFEIINSTEDKGYSIFFNKDFQLDLNAINYPASHQQLLKKLSTYFSFQKVNSPQNP